MRPSSSEFIFFLLLVLLVGNPAIAVLTEVDEASLPGTPS